MVEDARDMTSDRNAELINLLDLATKPKPNEESAVGDFVVALFNCLGYVRRHRIARTRKDLGFLICGARRYAKTDVCLIDREQNDILLLVQEDKHYERNTDLAYCQLIAKAIAAFNHNARTHREVRQPYPAFKIMPGIALVGSAPTFYKIPVTTGLVQHIAHGTYLPETTIVSAYVPDYPRPSRRYSEGMITLDNRQVILRCYEAFKHIVGIYN